MRLNKYIASAGVASRRKADELTVNGNVRINGEVVRELGYNVLPDDVVEVNGKPVIPSSVKVYIMLNKPGGYITSAKDEKDRWTVMDLVRDIPQRLFPVGRLDYNTTGLLLMTNDGDLANKLMHPAHGVGKTYRVQVVGVLSRTKVDKLRKGVDLGGYTTAPAQVTVIKQMERRATADITIYEGKNRQVRKMFKAVGCPVEKLRRTAIGELYLGRLAEGHYRKLTFREIDYLKNL